MASNKKINIPTSSLSSDEIYALLDSIESDKEEEYIENLMNDSDTEFVDRSVVENKDSDMHADEEPETTSNDAHSNLFPTHLPIQAVVRQDVSEEESSDDEPLITLAKQKEPVWKWRKRFGKTPLQPCSLKEEGVVNMQTENVTIFEAFSKCIGLPGLLSMMKIESERYVAQNGRQFQISEEEFCAFLVVNLLMGINKLPTMKSYWSVAGGLGNSPIQKAMTRARFLEILKNIHFADNHKELPPKESEEYDRARKLRPLFDHLGKHFQDMLQPEAHQSVDEHMCKFNGNSIMRQYMKNKPIGALTFGFVVEPSLATCMNSICIWERKEIPNLVSVNLLFFHCAISSKIRSVLHSFTTFLQVQYYWSSVRNGDLCHRYCEGQPKKYASFEV